MASKMVFFFSLSLFEIYFLLSFRSLCWFLSSFALVIRGRRVCVYALYESRLMSKTAGKQIFIGQFSFYISMFSALGCHGRFSSLALFFIGYFVLLPGIFHCASIQTHTKREREREKECHIRKFLCLSFRLWQRLGKRCLIYWYWCMYEHCTNVMLALILLETHTAD